MPTTKQIGTISSASGSSTYVATFNPVLGGGYIGGILFGDNINGFWLGSEAYGAIWRYRLHYTGDILRFNYERNDAGLYIRCISEEKTVTDLMYMQIIIQK